MITLRKTTERERQMKYWHKRVTLDHEVSTDDEGNEEIMSVLITEDGDTYPLEDFMRSCDGSRYDAVMGVSNTSAIGLILGADNETGVIQAFG